MSSGWISVMSPRCQVHRLSSEFRFLALNHHKCHWCDWANALQGFSGIFQETAYKSFQSGFLDPSAFTFLSVAGWFSVSAAFWVHKWISDFHDAYRMCVSGMLVVSLQSSPHPLSPKLVNWPYRIWCSMYLNDFSRSVFPRCSQRLWEFMVV